MTETVTRPIMRYHGGKWRLAPWIIQHFPAHRVYVEPFAGAASVLLRKPRCYAEIINDLDGEVVNVFRVMQNMSTKIFLQEALRYTPFSRAEFERAFYPADNDPIEQARRTIVRSHMGFASAAVSKRRLTRKKDYSNKPTTGFRANSNRSGTTPAHDWMHYSELLDMYCERLRGVVIENRDALAVIEHHDTPETLFFCDPPYVMSTRDDGSDYVHEMTDEDHVRLAELLHQVAGMVVLCGYQCDLYKQLYGDWQHDSRIAFSDGARRRTESIWMNPKASHHLQFGLFDEKRG